MGTVRDIAPYRESSLYSELEFLRKENARLRDNNCKWKECLRNGEPNV